METGFFTQTRADSQHAYIWRRPNGNNRLNIKKAALIVPANLITYSLLTQVVHGHVQWVQSELMDFSITKQEAENDPSSQPDTRHAWYETTARVSVSVFSRARYSDVNGILGLETGVCTGAYLNAE